MGGEEDDPNPNPIAIRPIPLPSATEKLPLACPALTRLLGGGIPIGSVTELSGESGSGKTQLSLHLLLSSQSPSFFVHTESPFPLRRLRVLAQNDQNALSRVFVRGAHSPQDLLSLLDSLSSAADPTRSRLLVVDSVAALFRSEFDSTAADLSRRSALFFRVAARLKQLARDLRLAVVVTNHVVDVVDEDCSSSARVGNWRELWSSGRQVAPALGLSWANCVNTRLFLSRREESFAEEGRTRTRRWMQVVFAPHLPPCSAEFVILKGGVFGVAGHQGRPLLDEMPV